MNWNYEQLLTEKFENIEKKIYAAVCEAARDMTRQLLEELDMYLMKTRDTKRYPNKQKRKTSVKTVYGTVEYSRTQYYDKQKKEYIYLLDEKMKMEKIGTISANLSKMIAEAAADMPYRKAADMISQTTGQPISSHGAWNVVQNIGTVIEQEEQIIVEEMEQDMPKGETKCNMLFMEADGVYLNIQKDRKKAKSQELKLATVYTGWSEDGKKLVNKKVIAGMTPAKKFNQKTEALIQSTFNIDKTNLRILNGDGAEWISNTYNPERIFQLDRFHIMKKIRGCISHRHVSRNIITKFMDGKYMEVLEDMQTYINSIDDGTKASAKAVKKVEDAYRYLANNMDGLPRWQDQAKAMGINPEAPEGMIYKNMGVQENQNCSLITNRMKGRKMRWSVEGADNLAKIIYTRENGDLDRVIEKFDGQMIMPDDFIISDILTPAKIKETVGKGSKWVDVMQATLPALSAPTGNYTDALRAISL